MMKYKKSKVIAEIGCNHKGDINIAKELIYFFETDEYNIKSINR